MQVLTFQTTLNRRVRNRSATVLRISLRHTGHPQSLRLRGYTPRGCLSGADYPEAAGPFSTGHRSRFFNRSKSLGLDQAQQQTFSTVLISTSKCPLAEFFDAVDVAQCRMTATPAPRPHTETAPCARDPAADFRQNVQHLAFELGVFWLDPPTDVKTRHTTQAIRPSSPTFHSNQRLGQSQSCRGHQTLASTRLSVRRCSFSQSPAGASARL